MNENESQRALRMIHPEAEEDVGSGTFAHADHVRNFQRVDYFHQSAAHRTHARELKTINLIKKKQQQQNKNLISCHLVLHLT